MNSLEMLSQCRKLSRYDLLYVPWAFFCRLIRLKRLLSGWSCVVYNDKNILSYIFSAKQNWSTMWTWEGQGPGSRVGNLWKEVGEFSNS